jgi:hypothetical protein
MPRMQGWPFMIAGSNVIRSKAGIGVLRACFVTFSIPPRCVRRPAIRPSNYPLVDMYSRPAI